MSNQSPLDISQLLSVFVAQSNSGYAIYDEKDVLIYANQVYAVELLEERPESIIGKTYSQIIDHAYTEKKGLVIETENIQEWLDHAQGKRWKKKFRTFEIDLLDGRWFLVTEQMIGSRFLFVQCTEITHTKMLEKKLKETQTRLFQQAYNDSLTNIPNRHSFIERSTEEINKASRNQCSLILFLFDLDHFKSVNDRFGHQAGDSVLQSISALVDSQLRDYDFLARIGGEEFAILFTDGSLDSILATVERIRDLLEKAQFNYKTDAIQCTASFGGAKLNPDESLEELLGRADKHLYQSKSLGRNRIVFEDDEQKPDRQTH